MKILETPTEQLNLAIGYIIIQLKNIEKKTLLEQLKNAKFHSLFNLLKHETTFLTYINDFN